MQGLREVTRVPCEGKSPTKRVGWGKKPGACLRAGCPGSDWTPSLPPGPLRRCVTLAQPLTLSGILFPHLEGRDGGSSRANSRTPP